MEKLYHINQKTGRPNQCKAQKGKCPLKNEDGTKAPHFDNKVDARAFIEKENNEKYGETTKLNKKNKKKVQEKKEKTYNTETLRSTAKEYSSYNITEERKEEIEKIWKEQNISDPTMAMKRASEIEKENIYKEQTSKLNPEEKVIFKLNNNNNSNGFTDTEVVNAYKYNQEEISKLRQRVGNDLDVYDSISPFDNYPSFEETSTRKNIDDKGDWINENFKNSLINAGVHPNYADYLVKSNLAKIGLSKDYVGYNTQTGKEFIVKRQDYQPIERGQFKNIRPEVQKGVNNFFNENRERLDNLNEEITDYKVVRDTRKEDIETRKKEYIKHSDVINERTRLLRNKEKLDQDIKERKEYRSAGIKTNNFNHSIDPKNVVTDKNGEIKNLFVKNNENKWVKVTSYDAGEFMGNNSKFIDENGQSYSTVRNLPRSKQGRTHTYLVDDTVKGEPMTSQGDFFTDYEHD